MSATAIMPSAGLGTPETYLDTERQQGLFVSPIQSGVRNYAGASNLALNHFALKGIWWATQDSITPVGSEASITGSVQAAKVYLVLTSNQNVPRQVRVTLDGQPLPNAHAGADVKDGVVTVTGQRLYSLVSFPTAQRFTFTVHLPPGVYAYDFTFG
jgi:hypothetical protein